MSITNAFTDPFSSAQRMNMNVVDIDENFTRTFGPVDVKAWGVQQSRKGIRWFSDNGYGYFELIVQTNINKDQLFSINIGTDIRKHDRNTYFIEWVSNGNIIQTIGTKRETLLTMKKLSFRKKRLYRCNGRYCGYNER